MISNKTSLALEKMLDGEPMAAGTVLAIAQKYGKMNQSLQLLVHLHVCEQEGILAGMPTPKQWMDAVEKANEALLFDPLA